MIRITDKNKRGKYTNAHCGKFRPVHPEKFKGRYIPEYKSALELKFMRYCDRNPAIIQWDYEGISIKYLDKSEKPERIRNYHIDFTIWVKSNDGIKKIWVEVKSQQEVNKPVNESDTRAWKTWIKNQCKWKQAQKTAAMNHTKFQIITEEQLN